MRLAATAMALVLLASPLAHAARMAIIMDSDSAELSLVDMDKRVEIRRIPVLREPHHNALSPDGKYLLVGDAGGNEVLFLDPQTGEIMRRVPVADPYQLGFSPNGKYLTVNGLARNQIDVYDAATMQLAHRFPIASMPSHLAYAPDSSMVYVSLQGTGKLVAIDLVHMKVVWDAPVGPAPAGVLWHAGKILVAIMGSDHIVVVDPVDGHVEQRIHTAKGAHQLFLSPDGRIIYVNNRVDGSTMALDATTLQIERTYKIPGGPDDIEFAPNGDLWITQRWAQKVAVLDPKTGNFQSIDVGRSPHGIFLTTDTPAR
jgi:DNA-binding beta-propeller fold protein YncE